MILNTANTKVVLLGDAMLAAFGSLRATERGEPKDQRRVMATAAARRAHRAARADASRYATINAPRAN